MIVVRPPAVPAARYIPVSEVTSSESQHGDADFAQSPISKPVQRPGSCLEAESMQARSLLIVVHCFLSFVLHAGDKIAISVAIVPIANELNFTQLTKGMVQAAFFVGYCTTQVCGGRLADRIGGRRVLANGVAVWSFMTLITPIAARTSLPALLAARCALGIGEGVAMPSMNALVQTWVPSPFVSRSLAVIYGGMHMGSILGLMLAPAIMKAAGDWAAIFIFFAIIGLVWTIVFVCTTTESPEESFRGYTATGTDEPNALVDNPSDVAKPVVPLPTFRELLSHKTVWAIICAHSCSAGSYFVLLLWMPSFLVSRWKLDLTRSAFLTSLPMVLCQHCITSVLSMSACSLTFAASLSFVLLGR
jgi:MFS transporter, ACS family, solute carrier family 17 (sodium-dependent inorganic phosphate cotransporter), other